jgi:ABC-2 type transport system ATP-binding protein
MAVVVEALSKSYGPLRALDDVDLRVEDGETVAVLGPNGAGKTTLIEILEGFRRPDAGRVEVLGMDPARGGRAFRERVGLMLQECDPEPYLTVEELIDLFGSYYRAARPSSELLDIVGLRDKAKARIRTLSGGQRRRLDMAIALVGNPKVLFLDEPTTGFDPEARRVAWDTVRALQNKGTTIVLTTHYLEEAEALAERVVVLAAGHIRADGPPRTLGARDRGTAVIRFVPLVGIEIEQLPVAAQIEPGGWVVQSTAPTKTLALLTAWAVERGIELDGLTMTRPTLEDAYLELIA